MRDPVFIVGTGRSGTSLLKARLNADPQLAISPEIHFFDRYLPLGDLRQVWKGLRAGPHFDRLGLSDSAAERAAAATTAREMYLALMEGHAESKGAEIPGDKTPSNFRYIHRLVEWFPNCRIAFTVRDPRAVTGSFQALAKEYAWARGHNAQHVALWNESAAAALQWQSDHRVRVVRYEDFVEDDATALVHLHPFLTSNAHDPMWFSGSDGPRYSHGSLSPGANTERSQIDSWRARLRSGEADVVLAHCQPAASELGYPSGVDGPALERLKYLGGATQWQLTRVARVLADPRAFRRRLRVRS